MLGEVLGRESVVDVGLSAQTASECTHTYKDRGSIYLYGLLVSDVSYLPPARLPPVDGSSAWPPRAPVLVRETSDAALAVAA